MPNEINREELLKLNESGDITLVDALSREEFEEGHLPGAVSVPLDDADTVAPEVLADKDAHIVTYCGSAECSKSKNLAAKLRDLGYTNVTEYAGGKKDWVGGGERLEEGAFDAAQTTGSSASQGATGRTVR